MSNLKEGDRLRKYEIIRPLGSGGMSKVYLAKDHKGKLYAIKEMAEFASSVQKEVTVKTFIKEVKILSALNHPGLPEFYEKFGCRRRLYIAMEYMEGDTLEDIIKSSPAPLNEERVLFWSIQLCEILFYLHTISPEPVIYRDLKPSNVIIDRKGEVRLVDFGIARYYDPRKNRDTINLGTPGYAAPEQCRKEGQSTPRTDIYALGVMMHQLLTLHDPSSEPFRFPPIRKINPGVSEQLEWIINKAISLNPADRYFDADLLKEELLDYYREKFGKFTSSYSNYPSSALEVRKENREVSFKNINYILVSLVIFLFFLVIYFVVISGDSGDSLKSLSPADLYNKGCRCMEEKNYPEAISYYDRALKKKPVMVDAHIMKGCALNELGKYPDAIKCFDRAIELMPTAGFAWMKKGFALQKLEKYEDAIFCYNMAPPDYENVYIKGLCFHEMGSYKEALECFSTSIAMKNNYPQTWLAKGNSFFKMGEFLEAIECWDKAVEIDPTLTEAKENKEKVLKMIEE